MSQHALLIDNEYCTGCHSCEITCKNVHDLPLGEWGIKVMEVGPWQIHGTKKWEFRYEPVPTSQCDLCEGQLEDGLPACVVHCLASAIEYGTVQELAQKMEEKGKMCSMFLP